MSIIFRDEINCTSPKTVRFTGSYGGGSVTVDGITHKIKKPFVCIATQNPVGSVGTQPLPDSQLDRFMVRLSIGYPSTREQVDIIKQRQYHNPIENVQKVVRVEDILEIQNYLASIKVTDEILE